MIKKFICVQGSPEIPKGTEVLFAEGLFTSWRDPNTGAWTKCNLQLWQVEGNECWEEIKEEKKAGRWVPEFNMVYYYARSHQSVDSAVWKLSEVDISRHKIGNVFRTVKEAQDALKRRESIANAWHPEDGEDLYRWSFLIEGPTSNRYSGTLVAEAYIGACHKTKEACEAWGKEYAHLFTKKSHN